MNPMNLTPFTTFTVEQENLICIYDTTTRTNCITEITNALPHFEDTEMHEIAESTLAVLHTLTDEEFTHYPFSPAYHTDEQEE